MRKHHILGALLTLSAWSISYLPATSQQASSVQIGQSAHAEPIWTPNPERGSASSTLSGGRRGIEAACASDDDQANPAVTLLVPNDGSAALTTEAQPTLAWYLESDRPANMEFMLSDPAQATPVYTQSMTAEAGFVEVSLPDSVALESDIRYRWMVFLSCHDGESEVAVRGFVERSTNDALVTDTSNMTELKQAEAYAKSGIWYDALNSLLQAYRVDSKTSTLLNIQALLEQTNTEVPLDLSLVTAVDVSH